MMLEARNRKENLFLTCIACLLAAAYNYVGVNMIPVAGFDFYLFLPIAAATVFIALCAFMVSPNFARMETLLEQLWIMLLPHLFPLVWSVFIWITGEAGFLELRKGLITTAYLASGICMTASLAYMAGGNAAELHLWTLLLSNLLTAVSVAGEGGFAEFLNQFLRMLATFAEDTGPLMARMEIHGITYALGCYLVFFLTDRKNLRRKWLLFLVAGLFFLLGLKRIAAAAVIVAAAVGFFFQKIRRFPEMAQFLLKLMGIVFLAGMLAYIGAVFYGLYDFLEEIGINTSARAEIYRTYRPYYDFSPAFTGNGLGWVEAQINIWSQTATDLVYNTHSEYLKQYIELGMIGCLIWCWLRCHVQVRDAFKRIGARGGILALTLTIYIAATYATDTTATQVFINNAFAVILFSFRLKVREHQTGQKQEQENRRRSEPYGNDLTGEFFIQIRENAADG